ncbi:NlpC/P60 family protein [Leptospira gomenensis]|uniref:NlpC/P60 family protein n=1 Tax=Leptospira gomenensis TaxID=2484974 RepID=A0A5F1YYR3_9LEPT|nr:NlpC/P60 family protein [Leptospira gomenensis]TGK39201.1 NlpC/P60 family protein [Leptospira gomenensis]TGK44258.1 NlpC/P60 family protein [Leptospira gomenensis]TGK45072.1 NlpC/P60 family protein [Leptospira gomenensis]TGK65120.1 NlpC/P60 family protein [Leptospira gomenensis]
MFRFGAIGCAIFLVFASLYVSLNGQKIGLNDRELREYFLRNHKLEITSEDTIELYREVHRWLGVPHKDFGTDESGIDCSGLTSKILSKIYGSDFSGPSYAMASRTKPIPQEKLKEGDLVFFTIYGNRVSHVGIYLKDRKFVHASSKRGVTIGSLDDTYYVKHFTSAGRR